MGTSSSSMGPGAGIVFDPPWLDTVSDESATNCVPNESLQPQDIHNDQQNVDPLQDDTVTQAVAPSNRFGHARRYFSLYMRDKNDKYIRKSLGHYVKKGMGGSSTLARRMRSSTAVGGNLFSLLNDIRNNNSANPSIQVWIKELTSKNLSQDDYVNEIINQLIPYGGTLESESSRDSINNAFIEFLTFYPDADIGNLNEDNIWFITQCFLANEAYNRLYLDLGPKLERMPDILDSIECINNIKSYLKTEIYQQIAVVKNRHYCTANNICEILNITIKETFEIFEGSL